uniref:Immunoglobulin V-set domain-containing protein n=1 Tax=Coturnix japonica TaxID=93934 RepID=A0A8C2TT17_COTJA
MLAIKSHSLVLHLYVLSLEGASGGCFTPLQVGGSLSFKCHHDPAGSYTTKYLCRWREASCSLLVDTDGFVHESYKGRTWISSSEQDSGNYTVVMSQLQEEDAGWYWCVARNGHEEPPFFSEHDVHELRSFFIERQGTAITSKQAVLLSSSPFCSQMPCCVVCRELNEAISHAVPVCGPGCLL